MRVIALCKHAGMSRENYYKALKGRHRREVDEGLVRQLVQAEHALQPRLGGLKLHNPGNAGSGR